MRLVRTVAAALIVAVLIAAIALATLPASFVYGRVAPRLAPLVLDGVSGTIWRGHAAGVRLLGRELGALDWTLDAWPLIRGVAAAQVTVGGGAFAARGGVSASGDRVELRDVAISLPAPVAAPVLAIPMLQPLGTIDITLARAQLRGRSLVDAQGAAHWRDAAVAGAAQARIGDLEARFASGTDGALHGSVRDLGGPLDVSGTFTLRDERYEAQARLAARANDAQLVEALSYVGQPNADGSRNLEIRGRRLSLDASGAQ